jgi:hypothetical protein
MSALLPGIFNIHGLTKKGNASSIFFVSLSAYLHRKKMRERTPGIQGYAGMGQ